MEPLERQKHVLVVDDDAKLRALLLKFLGNHGYLVTGAADADEARARMTAMTFDMLVLDVMMPKEDGTSLARFVRAAATANGTIPTPILMLTARGEAGDKIIGLESGVDDYLTKPFDPRELLLRIQAILRRASYAFPETETTETEESVMLGDAVFIVARQELRRGGNRIHLTEAEGKILAALARRSGTFLERSRLAEAAGLEGGERTVDVQVTRLRKKIEPNTREPRYLQTVRGRGYILRPGSTHRD